MPRMKARILEFGLLSTPSEDSLASIDIDITNLLNSSVAIQERLDGGLGEIFTQLRKTHLGHELHLWEAEVDEVE